ncbi:hypothetical protein J5N97_011652 [Dioscorea zingiberensis]|uniref:Sulfite exporter TauE/SafE family protein n=1 Tax=Dioscorea zingiberensis TaxID=325984 RepID=A0A9D5D342_9LILI|nr:hypothetical protein J5N97_011652 [Dioscorea zingiberensis]
MSQPFGDLVECLLNLVAQRMKQQMESMPGLPAGTEIRTAFAWILSFLAASISSAGGVGGGSLFLPILNLVLGLELKTAATFSAFMVTGGSLSNVIFNIFSRNSNSSRTKSLIDYEIALLSQPCLLLGSFIHIRPCGVGYLLITASQIPLAIGFTAFILYGKHIPTTGMKQTLLQDTVVQTGIETLPKVIFPIAALLSGILGGIFGIGGGLLINPVLLQIGVPPQTTAATTCFMVLFSSLMSSVQYLILGMKGVIVALVYAMLCFVGSILGLSIIQRIVLKSGRVSLIVFMVSIVMALSTVSITCFGAIDVWRAYNAGKSMGFKLPC